MPGHSRRGIRVGREGEGGRWSVLNLTCSEVFSVAVRGSSFVVMETPWLRAEGGMLVRNRRADREPAEKGLNLVFTSVMNRVIILGEYVCAVRTGCLVRGRKVSEGLSEDCLGSDGRMVSRWACCVFLLRSA